MARDWAYGRPPGEVRPRPSQPLPPIRLRRIGVVAASGVVVVGALGGVAQAFWTASGTGNGAAAAGVAQPLTFVAAATPSSLLYPGGKADVNLTVRNANPFAVTVTSAAAGGAVTVATSVGSCPNASTGVSFVTPTGFASFVVPARIGSTDGSKDVTLTAAASMDNTSANGCQGATFSIPVTLTGTS